MVAQNLIGDEIVLFIQVAILIRINYIPAMDFCRFGMVLAILEDVCSRPSRTLMQN